MGLGLAEAEMLIHAAFHSCIHLRGTLEMRGGLNVRRVEAEPNTGMALVYL